MSIDSYMGDSSVIDGSVTDSRGCNTSIKAKKNRARDLGLPFKGMPGPLNAITDVPGVEVGFTTIQKQHPTLEVGVGPINTGVTAILPRGLEDNPKPVWAATFDLNGNGEMTGSHWINDAGYFIGPVCITNTHSVGMVHHATTKWMTKQYREMFIDNHGWAMPVVAETYDGPTNDICGQHVTEEHVMQALASAASGPVAEGNVGGGTGMQTYEFKGGTGTSSRAIKVADRDFTVGALVQSNFGMRSELNLLGVPVGEHITDNAWLSEVMGHDQGSIVVNIGTDVPLSPSQLSRLAKRGAMGIARTGSPGGHYSGDLVLAFSVANEIDIPALGQHQPACFEGEYLNEAHLDVVYQAAVQAVEEAIINAMVAAETMAVVKPAGYALPAIDHDKLCAIMAKYNRLN